MRTAVITPVAGRRSHFRLQQAALRRSAHQPDQRIIVAMGPPPSADLAAEDTMVEVVADSRLPLAQARNLGAATAIANGAELLIFLDVDCVPSRRLIGRYVMSCVVAAGDLLCGPVHYLDPPGSGGYDLDRLPSPPTGHPARPTPVGDHIVRHGDHKLFWSLSFAVTAETWTRLGGFDEVYVGYGAEDTDFGQRAKAANIGLSWVGGAWAFHQNHPTTDPPTQHVEDIVRNARLFHERWGWWPMQGWLTEFERLGLTEWDPTEKGWRAVTGVALIGAQQRLRRPKR